MEGCSHTVSCFWQLTTKLRVPLAEEKNEGPCTVLTFLCIELDTVRQSSRIPQDKLDSLVILMEKMRQCCKVTLKKLQSLVGHLNFTCKAVALGSAFLWHFCDAMKGMSKLHHKRRVMTTMWANLAVWLTFLKEFNGISFWREELLLGVEFQVHSDASGSRGFGVYFRGRWCTGQRPDSWHSAGITSDLTFLKLFPIVGALWLWGHLWANLVVTFWCDNLAVVHILNSLSSRPERVMHLVHAFTLRCLRLNVLFKARHVPELENELVDNVSRNQMERFRSLAPQA